MEVDKEEDQQANKKPPAEKLNHGKEAKPKTTVMSGNKKVRTDESPASKGNKNKKTPTEKSPKQLYEKRVTRRSPRDK